MSRLLPVRPVPAFLSLLLFGALFWGGLAPARAADDSTGLEKSLVEAAERNAEAFWRSDDTLQADLREADPKSLLIPNFFMLNPPKKLARLNYTRYSPFNSGADMYCYLVLAAYFLEPELYSGKMLDMLRSERKVTAAEKSVPGEFSIHEQKVGGPSLFGAGEYAKDGLISVTEVVGDSPWHERMEEMILDLIELSETPSDFGKLPSKDTELNGDVLQVLPRLYWHKQNPKFLEMNRRIADAYFREVLPNNFFLPMMRWNFEKHQGVGGVRLRDHGNETIVGLVFAAVLESLLQSDRAALYLQQSRKMIDQMLASANPDGLLYNSIDPATLKPLDAELADNWGYVYGAVYNLYLLTGDDKYRIAIDHVLDSLPKYVNYTWEGPHYDGYADSIESAIYLVSRIPNSRATQWMDSEIRNIWKQQQADGHSDRTYLEGNFIRTSLLYGLMKSQGVFAKNWKHGLGIGATIHGENLSLLLLAPSGEKEWQGEVRFDTPRHKEIFHLPKNYLRLNEFPEWYVVDRQAKYRLGRPGEKNPRTFTGEQLAAGIPLSNGRWELEKLAPSSK